MTSLFCHAISSLGHFVFISSMLKDRASGNLPKPGLKVVKNHSIFVFPPIICRCIYCSHTVICLFARLWPQQRQQLDILFRCRVIFLNYSRVCLAHLAFAILSPEALRIQSVARRHHGLWDVSVASTRWSDCAHRETIILWARLRGNVRHAADQLLTSDYLLYPKPKAPLSSIPRANSVLGSWELVSAVRRLPVQLENFLPA